MIRKTIEIIRPSSQESKSLLTPERLAQLDSFGFDIRYTPPIANPAWPFCAASHPDRLNELEKALLNDANDIIWCARGGYGASDLLPDLDWPKLKTSKPKQLIGFSDISALHAAFYHRLGWHGIHAPMPATTLWDQDQTNDVDTTMLINFLLHPDKSVVEIPLQAITPTGDTVISGPLFGGCFSVLSNMIGTPYFPPSLKNHLLFLEDTGEHPARLMRYFNQWRQSGLLDGVRAIILGHFRDCCANPEDDEKFIWRQFADRSGLPVYQSKYFGHTSPNFPLMIGAPAHIDAKKLTWQMPTRNEV